MKKASFVFVISIIILLTSCSEAEESSAQVIFLRDNNLWVADISEGTEYQLTQETGSWSITSFSVSPNGKHLAYTPYNGYESKDALIKIVELPNGQVTNKYGENDRHSECCVSWLNQELLAYRIPSRVSGFPKATDMKDIFSPYHPIILNLDSGERYQDLETVYLYQSPDEKYELTCEREYALEGPCDFTLHYLESGERWRIAEKVGWGSFVGWSHKNSELMFFSFERGAKAPDTVQLVLVNPSTLEERTITPEGKKVLSASWSPDGEKVAYAQCDDYCELWLYEPDTEQVQRISIEKTISVSNLSWSPDGMQLLFYRDDDRTTVWSIEIAGSDMKRIIENAQQFVVPITRR